jgi:hypothetical protein
MNNLLFVLIHVIISVTTVSSVSVKGELADDVIATAFSIVTIAMCHGEVMKHERHDVSGVLNMCGVDSACRIMWIRSPELFRLADGSDI